MRFNIHKIIENRGKGCSGACENHVPRVGDKVLITGDHPHRGKVGTFISMEYISLKGGEYPKVQFPDGTACFVLEASEWKKL